MAKEAIKLEAINLKKNIPKVIMFGNGISMAAGKNSCRNLIEDIRREYSELTGIQSYREIEQIPFPMQVAIASGNDMEKVCKDISLRMKSKEYYSDIDYHIVEQMLAVNADVYLTTNYSYEAEMSLDKDFLSRRNNYGVFTDGVNPNKNGERIRESNYQLHSFYRMNDIDIWHMHGEAFAAKSIVLGHYYYGNLISQYRNDIKEYISKQKVCDEDYIIQPKSWLDYFIFGDVSIVGFSFDIAEADIWWLLDVKTAVRKKYKLDNKTEFYYTEDSDISYETKRMLSLYEVELIRTVEDNDKYKLHYETCFQKLQ